MSHTNPWALNESIIAPLILRRNIGKTIVVFLLWFSIAGGTKVIGTEETWPLSQCPPYFFFRWLPQAGSGEVLMQTESHVRCDTSHLLVCINATECVLHYKTEQIPSLKEEQTEWPMLERLLAHAWLGFKHILLGEGLNTSRCHFHFG